MLILAMRVSSALQKRSAALQWRRDAVPSLPLTPTLLPHAGEGLNSEERRKRVFITPSSVRIDRGIEEPSQPAHRVGTRERAAAAVDDLRLADAVGRDA